MRDRKIRQVVRSAAFEEAHHVQDDYDDPEDDQDDNDDAIENLKMIRMFPIQG